MNAPEQFMQNMQTLLQDEFPAYAASFSMPSTRGLRLNTNRHDAKIRCKGLPFIAEKIPYVDNGYFINEQAQPAKHPYYAAGLYYLQEPSAMLPADRLPVQKGDLVLDLCAAPGGKATALLAKLEGSGMLLANDISASRAKALQKNLVLTGFDNFFVSAEDPQKLAALYGQVFDKILVDAPCSGEGMFRHDPALMKDWMKKGPAFYAPIQKEILKSAVSMLKPGGMLLYSTCTFSVTENEENILWLLNEYPILHPVEIKKTDGMQEGYLGLHEAARCFPHLMKGEGHFLALLRKEEDSNRREPFTKTFSGKECRLPESLMEFLEQIRKPVDPDRIFIQNGCVLYLPDGYERLYRNQVRYLRTGLLLGSIHDRKSFKADQALALWLDASAFDNTLDLPVSDDRVMRYLRGETIFTEPSDPGILEGDVLICADHYALGFAKLQNGKLKNALHPGFIMH
ncbi:MAG: SAM-dependent methyltransferase [Lachnospiraceae bacterium]|nr:SAM-dependent methyltransferase [Lachnospiraceae bacterium]